MEEKKNYYKELAKQYFDSSKQTKSNFITTCSTRKWVETIVRNCIFNQANKKIECQVCLLWKGVRVRKGDQKLLLKQNQKYQYKFELICLDEQIRYIYTYGDKYVCILYICIFQLCLLKGLETKPSSNWNAFWFLNDTLQPMEPELSGKMADSRKWKVHDSKTSGGIKSKEVLKRLLEHAPVAILVQLKPCERKKRKADKK